MDYRRPCWRLQAGQNAGIEGGMHVFMGHGVEPGECEQAAALNCDTFSAIRANSIADALELIPLLKRKENVN